MNMFDHKLEPKPSDARRVEVFTGTGRRRRWSSDEKARIFEETLAVGAVVSEVARRHGITSQQLFGWRRSARGRAIERSDAPGFAAVMLEAPAEKAALDGAAWKSSSARWSARSVDRRRRDAGEDRSRAEGGDMIVPSSGVKVLIAMKPVDFRKGIDRLAAVFTRLGEQAVRRVISCVSIQAGRSG